MMSNEWREKTLEAIPTRLSASGNGETKCIIFVDSLQKARRSLDKYVNVIVGAYPFMSCFGAFVNIHRIDEIKNLDFVSAVSAHTTVHTCMCDVRSRLFLDEQSLQQEYGDNVTVAVIDTGLHPHIDFLLPKIRVTAFHDFVGGRGSMYDDNGHGTAVAGIIGGNGLVSFGKYKGIAPRVNIVALKAISAEGEGGAFSILEAMQWIFDNKDKYDIRVVCMSFGASPLEKNDPLSVGAGLLWQAGLTVVASAGNSGPAPATICSPGINPSIITVGAIDYKDNEPFVAEFSSRGQVGDYPKPDLVTDGVGIFSSAPKGFYKSMSGTSMSAPIVAGVCAAMLSQNKNLTNNAIKERLLKTATPLKADPTAAGNGKLSTSCLNAD